MKIYEETLRNPTSLTIKDVEKGQAFSFTNGQGHRYMMLEAEFVSLSTGTVYPIRSTQASITIYPDATVHLGQPQTEKRR